MKHKINEAIYDTKRVMSQGGKDAKEKAVNIHAELALDYADQINNFIGSFTAVEAPIIIAAMKYVTDAMYKSAVEQRKMISNELPRSYPSLKRLVKSFYRMIYKNTTIKCVTTEIKNGGKFIKK